MVDAQPVTPAAAQPVRVPLPAEIDLTNAGGIGGQLAAAFTPGVRVVIADMTGTSFCDSTGIRMLVRVWAHASGHGAELRLLVPSAGMRRVMTIHGLDRVLPIYQTLADAAAGQGALRPPHTPPRAWGWMAFG